MKVSIIVPVYNVEKYIDRCLERLVNQTLEDIEIITVNDASPDNSIKILREYEKKYPDKVIVIDSKENLKVGGARNKGIDKARGEYIAFVDGDDWVDYDMYENMYNKAKENDADMVTCDYVLSTGIGEDFKEIKTNDIKFLGKLNKEKKEQLLIDLGSVWSKIYKRTFINKNKIRFPEHRFYEDNEFVPIAIVHAEYIDKVSRPFYHYFKENTGSITAIKDSYHHFDRLETIKNVVDRLKKEELYDEYADALEFFFTKIYYINTIGICIYKFQNPPLDKMYEIRKYMKENYPKYYKNKYFKKVVSRKMKLRCFLHDLSPRLLIFFAKIKKMFRKKK